MFRCCKPSNKEKPLITKVILSGEFTLECTEDEFFSRSIPIAHSAVRLPNNTFYRCTFSQTYDCISNTGLEKSFIALWEYLIQIYELFPDKVNDVGYQIQLASVANNKTVSNEFDNMDAFHEFLATHRLIATEVLHHKLTLSYRYRAVYNPAGSEDINGQLPINLDQYEDTINDITKKIEHDRSQSLTIKSESIQLELKGRIGSNFIKLTFDDTQSLEYYLASQSEEKTEITQSRP